jgi:ketosteroid isomerase-like protein
MHKISMMDTKYNRIHAAMLVNRSIVFEYFRLIKNKDINRLLDLFADDATIYEPFSKIHGGLHGMTAIKAFLEVALMASDGLQHEIRFEKQQEKPDSSNKYNNNSNNDNQVTALVTFERGGTLKARFTFELSSEENYNSQKQKKIQSMLVQFIE